MKLGYARISTPKQSLEYQVVNLKEAGCEKIFTDVYSGMKEKRPGFDRMSEQLRSGDIVTITTLDRLGRSNRFLVELIDDWNKSNIHIHILSHQIDTTTCQGKFMFDIMAALAEQERNLIRERIKKGLEGARARGMNGGRPKKLNDDKVKRLKELYEINGLNIKELCIMFDISKRTLYNYINKQKVAT